MRQLLDHAAENDYGVPAFNVNNMEQMRAIMEAADECDSPVILQGSAGARKYAGEAFLRHLVAAAVETWPHIPVVMHRDHGARPAVCQKAIRSGFTSVMMDGSLLPPSYCIGEPRQRQCVPGQSHLLVPSTPAQYARQAHMSVPRANAAPVCAPACHRAAPGRGRLLRFLPRARVHRSACARSVVHPWRADSIGSSG
jgi:Fructose-bisphosphate aldolase class-II